MPPVSIGLFVSHPVAASQYTRLLAAEKDFRLVADGGECRVGVFDCQIPSLDSVLALARLKYPSMRPLLVAPSSEENECLRWLFRGMWGLVSYDGYEKDLPHAVRQIASGHLWFPPSVVTRWMHISQNGLASSASTSLTSREREVTDFLLRRLSNKEIASILGISERTVKFHVGNILGKLQLNSRQELSASWLPRFEPAS